MPNKPPDRKCAHCPRAVVECRKCGRMVCKHFTGPVTDQDGNQFDPLRDPAPEKIIGTCTACRIRQPDAVSITSNRKKGKTMQRLTTRSIRTAQAIRDREEFITSGALRGEAHVPTSRYLYSGYLSGQDAEALTRDLSIGIDYVVWSYSTPIAWHKIDGTWHIVSQKFSRTTTKHQGNLYLI